MGGIAIEKIREGVEFTPDAAAAFRRAEARVQDARGRNIDVNSTYRSRSKQLAMYNAWEAYVGGWGPYPGHSKALHPDDPLAFHVTGEALDSDDWRDAWIVQVLAENGFIRNRLYVPNEEHHFEYIRSKDRNYGKEVNMELSSKDVKRIGDWTAKQNWNGHKFKNGRTPGQVLVGLAESMARIEVISAGDATFFKHGGNTTLWIYVMPNGDFVRIRDLETARLYKERSGRQSVTLSTEAIRLLVADLTDSGGRDLTATSDGEVETSTQDA